MTNLCLSAKGNLFAMCERSIEGERGLLTIFEVVTSKKKAVLPDDEAQKS